MNKTVVIVGLVVVAAVAGLLIWSPWNNTTSIANDAVCTPVDGASLKVVPSSDPLAHVVVDGMQVKLWPFVYEQAGSVMFFQADFQFAAGRMMEYGYPAQWQAVVAQTGALPIDAAIYPYAVASCGSYVVIWRSSQIPMSPSLSLPQPAGVMPLPADATATAVP